MKAILFIKTGDLTKKICAIIIAVCVLVASIGWLVECSLVVNHMDSNSFYKEARKHRSEMDDDAKAGLRKMDEYLGLNSTLLALSIATLACWAVFVILWTLDKCDAIRGLIFYGAVGVSIASIVFGVTLACWTGKKAKSDFVTIRENCFKAAFVDMPTAFSSKYCQDTLGIHIAFSIVLAIACVLALLMQFEVI